MKKILITGGATNEHIDEVMKITNMSTGRLSMELSNSFASLNNTEVTLIGNRSLRLNSLFERFDLSNRVKFIPIETTTDMHNALKNESEYTYDLIIHSAAVGDYKPTFCFKMEDIAKEIFNVVIQKNKNIREEDILNILIDPKCKVNDDTKISSYEQNLTVKLGLTIKLISNLRVWFPNAKLVGFKLLNDVSKEHIIDVATKLCIKNKMDYIIANDLYQLRQGNHLSHLVSADGYEQKDFHSPNDIFVFVKNLF